MYYRTSHGAVSALASDVVYPIRKYGITLRHSTYLTILCLSLSTTAKAQEVLLELNEVQLIQDTTATQPQVTQAVTDADEKTVQPAATIQQSVTLDNVNLLSELQSAIADQRTGIETQSLTIEDVRKTSLENNLGLKARFIQSSIANERLQESQARFARVISGDIALTSQEISLDTNPVPAENAPTAKLNGYRANIQLEVPLRTGGNIEIAMPTTFTDPDVDNVDSFQNTSLSFSINQPLLKNAGRAIAETPIEISRLQSGQELARVRLAAIQTIAAAETAYWNFYAATAALNVRRRLYESALDLERKAKRLAQVDVVSDIEVTRAESGVARSLEGVIVAETDRRTSQRALIQIMNDSNLPLSTEKDLIAASNPNPQFNPADRAAIVQKAIENRQELTDLKLQLSVDELSEVFNQNQLKPQLDLIANTTLSDTGDSLGDSIGSDLTSWEIGAAISFPLGNDAAKARFRQSSLQRKSTELTLKDQQRLITQQALDGLDRLEQSWQRILASRNEVALAGKTYQAEERQFLAGVRTSSDVLESLDFLAEAQLREVQSLSFHELQKVDLALTTGTLLDKSQIVFNQ